MARPWLVAHRENAKMTHEQVAIEAKISRQYYGMIESGDRDPSVDVAKRIASVMGFSWTLFFGEDGNDTLPKEGEPEQCAAATLNGERMF